MLERGAAFRADEVLAVEKVSLGPLEGATQVMDNRLFHDVR